MVLGQLVLHWLGFTLVLGAIHSTDPCHISALWVGFALLSGGNCSLHNAADDASLEKGIATKLQPCKAPQ